MDEEPFARHGDAVPASPVVLSVPHAGRTYPLALRAALRVPLGTIESLEDRYVDALAQRARGTRSMVVQTAPRAWIDLNRGEDERDPRVDEGAPIRAAGLQSAKLRSGLGLVPRRATGAADIWRHRFSGAEIDHRISTVHRPYHAALATMLAMAHARFGIAVLLDVHSMPPLSPRGNAARLVVGDRFGKSAAARFVARIEGAAQATGVRASRNSPYAGGHILARHGAPDAGIHAIQLEFDRSLYLDAKLTQPGPGLVATAALLRRIADAVEDEALACVALPIAAE